MQGLLRQLDYSAPLYNLLYFALIIFFCFFYVSIIFNPMDQADNMKKYGGFIPGIRPGQADRRVHRQDPDPPDLRRGGLPGG